MAYQNIGTPRFYINDISYAKSIGIDITDIPMPPDTHFSPTNFQDYDKLFDDDPTNTVFFTPESVSEFWVYAKTFKRPNNEPNYVAYLNHNIKESGIHIRHTNRKIPDIEGGSTWNDGTGMPEDGIIVNGGKRILDIWEGIDAQGGFLSPEYNGFTICEIGGTIDGINNDIHNFQFYMDMNEFDENNLKEFRMGCIFVGRYYDMPVNPDLDLSMDIEFDGYDNTRTLNGSTLTNTRYMGSPWWFDTDGNKKEPWAVGDSTGLTKRNGRRVWNLSFSYMSDKDLFASNYGNNTYMEADTDYDNNDLTTDNNGNNVFQYTIDNDDSFSAQVLNKVSHGQKFIFQPDNTNNNPDQFAICVLDQDSLDIKRVAPRTYNIKMKIKEVW